MLAPIDSARVTPRIYGLPDCLKIMQANVPANAQECIQTLHAMNAAAAAAQPPLMQAHLE